MGLPAPGSDANERGSLATWLASPPFLFPDSKLGVELESLVTESVISIVLYRVFFLLLSMPVFEEKPGVDDEDEGGWIWLDSESGDEGMSGHGTVLTVKRYSVDGSNLSMVTFLTEQGTSIMYLNLKEEDEGRWRWRKRRKKSKE